MAHTAIEVVAPDVAAPGELIEIQITIYNITVFPNEFNIDYCLPWVKTPDGAIFGGDARHIPPKEYSDINYEIWSFEHVMPAEDLKMTIESWFETDPIYDWHLDTILAKEISLGNVIEIIEVTPYVLTGGGV